MNIQCQICKATFLQTTKAPACVTPKLLNPPRNALLTPSPDCWSTPQTSTKRASQTAFLAPASEVTKPASCMQGLDG